MADFDFSRDRQPNPGKDLKALTSFEDIMDTSKVSGTLWKNPIASEPFKMNDLGGFDSMGPLNDFNIPGASGNHPSNFMTDTIGSNYDFISDLGPAGSGRDWGQFWLGGTNKDGSSSTGAAMPALQLASGAMKTWLGLKQLGVAEDTLDFQKDAFSKQFLRQEQGLEAEYANRKARAIAGNPNTTLYQKDKLFE